MKRPVLLVVAMCLALAGIAGCTAAKIEDFHTIDAEDAEGVEVDIVMGIGQLWITGGADVLMNARFLYESESWKPSVSYRVADRMGQLEVRQPNVSGHRMMSNFSYEWDLQFGRDVPVDLMTVDLGVGTADLRIGDLPLRNLELKLGVGDVAVDLSGPRSEDLNVSVEGGVGRCVLDLPGDVGVRVEVDRGIAHVDVSDLHRRGDEYVNDLYGDSDVTVNLKVAAGVGQIVVRAGR